MTGMLLEDIHYFIRAVEKLVFILFLFVYFNLCLVYMARFC